MESKVETLVNILIDFIEEPDNKMGEQIEKAVQGYEPEVIQQAFCEVTEGEFVEFEQFPKFKILNRFPHIVIKQMKKGPVFNYPHIKENLYYIRIDQ